MSKQEGRLFGRRGRQSFFATLEPELIGRSDCRTREEATCHLRLHRDMVHSRAAALVAPLVSAAQYEDQLHSAV